MQFSYQTCMHLFLLLTQLKPDNLSEKEEVSQKVPEFIVPPRNLHVAEEASAILSCKVSGDPPPSVQWQKQRQTLKHGHKYKVNLFFILHLKNFSFNVVLRS